MNLTELILLSIALGIDCLVVSFSQGLIFANNRFRNSFLLALTMGVFQGGMPIFGYYGTGIVSNYLEKFSSWIVFLIFLTLGIKFIIEALKQKDEPEICCIGFKCLVSMGVATSIDALGAGVSVRFSNTNLWLAMLLIGVGSFVMSLIGFWGGNSVKHLPARYLEVTGGVILIMLGVKALFM